MRTAECKKAQPETGLGKATGNPAAEVPYKAKPRSLRAQPQTTARPNMEESLRIQ
jgi:hypothetical protein